MASHGSYGVRVLEGGLHQPIRAEIVPVLHLQHRGKLGASPVDPALDRAFRDTAASRHIRIGLALLSHQEESLALLQRQAHQCPLNVVQKHPEFLLGLHHQASGQSRCPGPRPPVCTYDALSRSCCAGS